MTKHFCNKCAAELTELEVKGSFYCQVPKHNSVEVEVKVNFSTPEQHYYAKDLHFCRACLLKVLTN